MQRPSKTCWLVLTLFVFPAGCAAPAATGPVEGARAPSASNAPTAPAAAPEGAASANEAPPGDSDRAPTDSAPPNPEPAAASATAMPELPPPGTPLDGRPADPSRSLPEVRVRQIGMHIGGGPNDADSKKPFLKAIEARNQKYLLCYRFVRSPMQGGTFGVDLFVSPASGVPEVRATRQRLGGSDFESCMVDAFNGVRFGNQPKPTTLSYSMRFDVRDPSKPTDARAP